MFIIHGKSRSLPAELLPSQPQAAQPHVQGRLSHVYNLALLNIVRFLLAHSSRLLRSLCMAALPSSFPSLAFGRGFKHSHPLYGFPPGTCQDLSVPAVLAPKHRALKEVGSTTCPNHLSGEAETPDRQQLPDTQLRTGSTCGKQRSREGLYNTRIKNQEIILAQEQSGSSAATFISSSTDFAQYLKKTPP